MEQFTIRTSIKRNFLRSTLFRGTILSAIAMLFLSYAALFLSPDFLNHWGLVIFLGCSIVLSGGLLPFRKLTRLEGNPNKIVAHENRFLEIFANGDKQGEIAVADIDSCLYEVKEKRYGLTIKKKTGATHFFPYYSEKSVQQLNRYLFSRS